MRTTVYPIFLMILGMLLVIISPVVTQAYSGSAYGIDCLIWGLAAAFLGLVWMGLLSLNINFTIHRPAA